MICFTYYYYILIVYIYIYIYIHTHIYFSPVPSQDHSLVQLLASLADGGSPAGTQLVAQVSRLEDQDAILSQQTAGSVVDDDDDNEDERQQVAESLEMSERLITEDDNLECVDEELNR